MIANRKIRKSTSKEPYIAHSTAWIRAPGSGIFRTHKSLGSRVKRNELLGLISDPVSSLEIDVISPFSGIIIGRSELPLVHEGEAVYHIARFEDAKEVAEQVGNFHDDILPDIDYEDDEIAIV